jgi:hypothetical protein
LQAILAPSRGPGWKTSSLKAATDLTKLDISILIQPHISPDIANFFERNGDGTSVTPRKHGSTLAWLAHLDLLKYVVVSGFSTALIVEDGVDWDVLIAMQMRRLSGSARELLKVPDMDPTPYGTDWDVIWIGHCGEKAEGSEHLDNRDDSRVTTECFHGFSKKLWMDEIPEGHRRLQAAVQLICTFAYAVTAAGAQNILQALGSGKDEAFSIRLQHQCTNGSLRCYTVVPQVMQHYEPAQGLGYVSNINEESGFRKSSSDEVLGKAMGLTSNVVQSARCKALFNAQLSF